MVHFLSCDWGTSSFRLRLVKAQNAETIAIEKSDKGIAATFKSFSEKDATDPEERRLFYLRIIQDSVSKIEQEKNISLKGVPLVLSGMASSSIGMAELPYRNLPFSIDGTDTEAAYFEQNFAFAHPVLLISGVRSAVDVMRGEETQLIGTIADNTASEGLYIFPGTHSKHIEVKDGHVSAFRTYMTGEVFELLAKESILRVGLEKSDNLRHPSNLKSFKEGVLAAKDENLLHSIFRARTNNLFSKLSKEENFNYLSGLLLGTELKDLAASSFQKVYLCSDFNLRERYKTALDVLGLQEKVLVFPEGWAEEAVVRGQLKIYKHYIQNK